MSAHLRYGRLFRQFGITPARAALQTAHDADVLLYKGSEGRQILEEGIIESRVMAASTAAGTFTHYGVDDSFFIYIRCSASSAWRSIWACRFARQGFLCGGTAGRTTLSGEGLQHQEKKKWHSIVHAGTVPTCTTTIRR